MIRTIEKPIAIRLCTVFRRKFPRLFLLLRAYACVRTRVIIIYNIRVRFNYNI